MSESDTSRWTFTYDLTEKIYCAGNLKGDDSVEFVTESKNKPIAITGFKITSKLTHQEDAKKEANLTAEAVSDCMTILSKKNIKHRLNSMMEILNEGTGKIEVYGTIKTSTPTIVFNIDIKAFRIRNIPDGIKASVAHFTNALKAKESGDYKSMLRYLWLIYEDGCRNDLDKYRFLRNAVSHVKLHSGTINGLNKHYNGRLDLTNKKTCDFELVTNKRLVTTEANELLGIAHKDLNKNLGTIE